MKIRAFFKFIALALLACNQAPTESPFSLHTEKIIDVNMFSSYRGFDYDGDYRTGIVMTTVPGGISGTMEIWIQKADSTTALLEWTARSESVSVDTLGLGTEKAVLRDVSYEKSIGAQGLEFPTSPLELRLTRIAGDTIKLEIVSPTGMPAPFPLPGGSLLLTKDKYYR